MITKKRITFAIAGLAIALTVVVSGPNASASASAGARAGTVQAVAEETASTSKPRLAIVIDDFGNAMKGTSEMLTLPIKLTVAVMPFLPTTKQDAEDAYAKGHDVIVHLPMEPISGKKSWLGPGAITTDLPDAEIWRRVEAAIRDVPHAIGMNNHMGSRVTSDPRVMRIVLGVCKEHGLFFLDSRTSFRTIVPKVAKEVGVSVLGNNVFLDDVYTSRHVNRQISVLRKFLHDHNECIVIGHVGPPGLITSGALKTAIPQLSAEADFIKVSQLVQLSALPMAQKHDTP